MDRDKPARNVESEDFASWCDELLSDVEQRGDEIVITRDGAAIARLIPFTEEHPFVGRSCGTIKSAPGDLLAPIGEDWEVDQDL
ncbi:MAG TPA: hypothetical protein VFY65_18335 [Longimicrobium sp.]|nr:hypothetical protein [Longimicrobium sp.]